MIKWVIIFFEIIYWGLFSEDCLPRFGLVTTTIIFYYCVSFFPIVIVPNIIHIINFLCYQVSILQPLEHQQSLALTRSTTQVMQF